MAEEYIKRTERYSHAEMREIHATRFDLWAKHPQATKVLLDPQGKTFNSFQFAELVRKAEDRGRDLAFVIGGAEGYPAGWREKADLLWSLSAMTLPHELARVIVAEQIYRAFTILRGHPYSK
jgi:23S rRNA (pseudouridine1915-N3)-methyltransferase